MSAREGVEPIAFGERDERAQRTRDRAAADVRAVRRPWPERREHDVAEVRGQERRDDDEHEAAERDPIARVQPEADRDRHEQGEERDEQAIGRPQSELDGHGRAHAPGA